MQKLQCIGNIPNIVTLAWQALDKRNNMNAWKVVAMFSSAFKLVKSIGISLFFVWNVIRYRDAAMLVINYAV